MIKIYKALILIIVILIIYIIYFEQNAIYSYNDAYAYIAYARSLVNFGELFDITVNPHIPISRAQQLGIVYFGYYPLMLLGFSDSKSFIIIQSLSILNAIVILYLLYKIIEKYITKLSSSLIILILILNFNYWAYFSAPINDGFFITSLLISFLYLEKNLQKNIIDYKHYLIIFIITLFGMQFRLQFLCLNISFIILLLSEKKFIDSGKFLITTFLAVITSIFFGLFLTPSSALSADEIAIISKLPVYNVSFYYDLILAIGDQALIPMIIGNGYFIGSTGFFYKVAIIVSYLIIIFGIIIGLKYSKFIKLISIFCIFTLLLLVVSPVYIDRYIYVVLPFILLFYSLFFTKFKNYILLSILFFVFLINSYRFFIYPPLVTFNHSSNVLLKCLEGYNFELMSEDTRYTYYDTNGKASILKFTDSKNMKVSYGIIPSESSDFSESDSYRVNRLYKRQFGQLINYSYTVRKIDDDAFLKCIDVGIIQGNKQ